MVDTTSRHDDNQEDAEPSRVARPQPNFARMGAGYDITQPLTAPVTDALIARLPDIGDGLAVDIGCGTGEPGLSLARRSPRTTVVGIDPTSEMLERARSKAEADGLDNIRFTQGSAEKTGIGDGGAAAVVSRFGLLAFGDPEASASEVARILAPGGAIGIAVWHDPTLNTLMFAALTALRRYVPADRIPPFDRPSPLADGGAEHLLHRAGLTSVRGDTFAWAYHFDSEPELWEFLASAGVLGSFVDTLDVDDRQAYRHDVTGLLSEHRRPDGMYRIPQGCLLLHGRTP